MAFVMSLNGEFICETIAPDIGRWSTKPVLTLVVPMFAIKADRNTVFSVRSKVAENYTMPV